MAALIRRKLTSGERIRVLVVDDSVVIRRLIARALAEDPDIEVVGFAADGAAALRSVAELRPDIVTLDVEMPVMDGLETLRRLRAAGHAPIVLMFSTLTSRGATATIDALSMGASDYVTKASNAGSAQLAARDLRDQLLPKIKQFFSLHKQDAPRRVPVAVMPARLKLLRPRRVVAIGVSTGGPSALADILPLFPADFHLPVLIVQHMPAVFTRLLADRLNTLTPLHVQEAAEGTPIVPGAIYIAPGGFHMGVRRDPESDMVSISLNQDAPEHFCRPAVDVLFRSVNQVYGAAVVAAVLTGMGADGALGAQAMHSAGAYVIAQDEQSSVVWGMPAAVVQAGAADAVLDLQSIVPEILKQI